MLGQLLIRRLADDYVVRSLDIRPAERIQSLRVADYGAFLPHREGVDVVIHLGPMVQPNEPWDKVLEHNIIGTRNVFEAATRQGARRVVFASSHQSMRMYEDEEPYASALADGPHTADFSPIRTDMPFRPSGFYGTSKAFGEVLGRVYVDHIRTISALYQDRSGERRESSARYSLVQPR